MKKYCLVFLISIAFSLQVFAKVDPPFSIQNAIDVIESNFGDVVEIKPKTLLKFGKSDQVSSATQTTLMDLPSGTLNETYVSTNIIDTVSSSDASDTQTIRVEGHTIDSNGEFTFRVQNVTLTGQTKAVLGIPLARVSRVANTNGVAFAGDIYVYQEQAITAGVPQTDSEVHLIIFVADAANQSKKAATTISKDDYYIVTQAFASINQKSGSPIAELRLEVREKGGVFRVQAIASVATAGLTSTQTHFNPPVIIPKNADVRLRALSSANGVKVSGWFNGYLAKIKR